MIDAVLIVSGLCALLTTSCAVRPIRDAWREDMPGTAGFILMLASGVITCGVHAIVTGVGR